MAATYKRAIHWFRRDLRITDNTALSAAILAAEEVVPVYVVGNWKGEHAWTGAPRQQFLCECLAALEGNIESLGGRMLFRRGKAIEVLEKLVKESEAGAVFWNRDPDPFGQGVDKALHQLCRKLGIDAHPCKDHVLHEPDEALTQSGDPFRVYTPYSRVWRALDRSEPGGKPKRLATPESLATDPCPALETWGLDKCEADILRGGERAARSRMKKALEGPLRQYGNRRNTPAGQTTSRLSQDLRFGLISIRELYQRCEKAAREAESASVRKSFGSFIGELAWREFYMAILAHWPEVLEEEFNPKWRGLTWEEADERFERWKHGETGFPIVDAGMRELKATGFMHNRLRMIVAMFLTKDLRIDWRHGERYFMQALVDGEIASNNGGWQWSAGTGADAAPYFRIQNPWTQSERYDKRGEYIKQWVPELAEVDPSRLHQPPGTGKALVDGYPAPMVNHAEERKATLDWFAAHKEKAEG